MTPQQTSILIALSFPRSLKTLYKIFPNIPQGSLRRTLYDFQNKKIIHKTLNGKWVQNK